MKDDDSRDYFDVCRGTWKQYMKRIIRLTNPTIFVSMTRHGITLDRHPGLNGVEMVSELMHIAKYVYFNHWTNDNVSILFNLCALSVQLQDNHFNQMRLMCIYVYMDTSSIFSSVCCGRLKWFVEVVINPPIKIQDSRMVYCNFNRNLHGIYSKTEAQVGLFVLNTIKLNCITLTSLVQQVSKVKGGVVSVIHVLYTVRVNNDNM